MTDISLAKITDVLHDVNCNYPFSALDLFNCSAVPSSLKHLFWLPRNHILLVSFLPCWLLLSISLAFHVCSCSSPCYFSSLSSTSLSATSLVASSCLMALNTVYMLTTSKFMNLIQTTTLNFRIVYPTAYLTHPPDYPIVISDFCPKLSSWSSLMPQTCFHINFHT